MRENLIYIAIGCGVLFSVIVIELIVYLLITIISKKKYNLRIAKVENEFYLLSPIKNKGKSFVELYANRDMAPEVNETNVVVDEVKETKEETAKPRYVEIKKVSDKKNHLIFHYYDIKDPYLNIIYYENGTLAKQKRYYLSEYRVENGVITNLEDLARIIKEDFNYNVGVDLKLSINEYFKHSVSLPKINKYKANKLSAKELKQEFPNSKNKYYQISNKYSHKLGYIYDTYFIPTDIILCFRKLCSLLNCKLVTYDLYGSYIYNIIKHSYEGSYSYIHTHDNMGLFINVNNNKLTTMYDFTFNNYNDLINQYLVVVSKREFEYEKEKLNTLFVNSSYYEELTNVGLDVKPYNVDLTHYHSGGVKI